MPKPPSKAPKRVSSSPWEKTRAPNVFRNSASGTYYARFRVSGKLVWRSLETKAFTTAKTKLPDVIKAEKQLIAAGDGQITLTQAAKAYLERDERNPGLKEKTRQYRAASTDMIGRNFPRGTITKVRHLWATSPKEKFKQITCRDLKIRDITKDDCLSWAAESAKQYSPTTFNHALGTLREIIAIGIELGARFDNPATFVERLPEKPKSLKLPEPQQFLRFIEAIKTSGSGWSKPCADMVRFLAYGGFRLTEANNVTWGDVDLAKGEIIVRGDLKTGLKGRVVGETRRVPIIAEMRQLLERLQAANPVTVDATRVLCVRECQKAMNRAATEIGMARITHHDLRHLFATRCIESGVDIPTVARWLGHKDGGALAMRVYGHLRDAHSQVMASKVSFS